ncbi:Sec-independent protein translocase protein TatB [Phytohalomonas tamaricis]|uniref:Sec-independent protein translocase protein TatB n=1 Tax=Phytohalomonas tamaricis TaxID=2081032 RepID=UPI000D0BD134|nr:Sec-independent protein translocase protein TatB [Phytohalomonas tamaricis]
MFDVSFSELLVIGVIALIVLGPERLPTAARTAGLWLGKIKRTVANVQQEITSQLEAEELRRKLSEQQKRLDDGLSRARDEVESLGERPQKPRSTEDVKKTSSTSVASPSVPIASTAKNEDTSEVNAEEPPMPSIDYPPSPEGDALDDYNAPPVKTSYSDNADKDTQAR